MAWIRADVTNKFTSINVSNVSSIERMLNRKLNKNEKTANINLNFDEVYENSIYTSYESILGLLKYLDYYDLKVDIVLFTGHAGNGHRAPTRAIAKKLVEKTDKNVIIIDILALFSKFIANFNDKAWVMMSRSKPGQIIWNKVIRGEINPEKTGFDIAPIFKVLYTEKFRKLMNKLSPSVVLSTYPYSNAILSEIVEDTPSIAFAGIVVTDIEYIGTNPCFFDKEANNTYFIKNTVLFVPGSAEGLGMGIKALPKLAEFCKNNNKKLICISGLGRPYNFAKKVYRKYKDTMTLFSYVASADLKKLIERCEVIVGKAGGNLSSEFVSKSGCKIFFGSIKGQETDNAEYYDKLGVATNVGSDVDLLLDSIEKAPYTPSVYEAGIIQKSAVDIIVDTILPYLKQGV